MRRNGSQLLRRLIKRRAIWLIAALAIAVIFAAHSVSTRSYADVWDGTHIRYLTADQWLHSVGPLFLHSRDQGMLNEYFVAKQRAEREALLGRALVAAAICLILFLIYLITRTARGTPAEPGRLPEGAVAPVELNNDRDSLKYVYFGGLSEKQQLASHAIQDLLERATGHRLVKSELHPYLSVIREIDEPRLELIIAGMLSPEELLRGP